MTDDAKRLTRSGLAKFLAQALGQEKAEDAVGKAADELGFKGDLTKAEALRVLDKVAAQPGIVGISARFAKSRVLLS